MPWHAFALSASAEKLRPSEVCCLIRSKVSPNVEVFYPGEDVGHRSINLFDGYVFVRNASDAELVKIRSLNIISSRITTKNLMIPDEDILRLKELLQENLGTPIYPGDHVQVVAGPAEGLNGVVLQVIDDEVRIFLDYNFLWQLTVVPKGDLEVISTPNKLLIDGPDLFRRAYYLPKMINPAGAEVQAVYGFFAWLCKARELLPRHDFYVVWGDVDLALENPALAHLSVEAQASYKMQLDMVHHALRFLPVFQVEAKHLTSEDVLAYLVGYFDPTPVVVMSHNQVFLPLVSDRVVQAMHKKSSDEGLFEYMTKDKIMEVYGLPPEKLRLYFALRGGVSADIRPVPGISEEMAKKLCSFESVEDLLCHAGDQVDSRTAEILERNSQLIMENYSKLQFAQIVAPEIRAGSLALKPLKDLFSTLGFQGFLHNLRDFAAQWDRSGFLKLGVSVSDMDTGSFQSPDSCFTLLEQPVI